MKPTFALNITDDGFVLLHRTAKGWTSVGEAAYSAPDLPEAMERLRSAAAELVPKGLSTKLVIPNSQILYTEVEAPGPSDAARRRQIAAALEGQTPYEVKDLVYDWSGKGPKVQVVAVARETLREAEAFAVEHKLNPLSFVAIPPEGSFDGEPYFGLSSFAPGFLKGETVERDPEPILPGVKAAPVEAPAPEAAPEAAPPAEDPPKPADPPAAEPEPRPAPEPIVPDSAPYAPLLDAPSNGIERALAAQRSVAERANAAEPERSAVEPSVLGASLTPGLSPAAAAAAAAATAAVAAAKAAAAGRGAARDAVPEAPFADVPEPLPAPDLDDVPDMPGTPPRGGLPDDVPPAPASSIRMAFASRRAAGEMPPSPPLSVPSSVAPVGASAVGRPAGGAIGTPPPIGGATADAGEAGASKIVRGKPVEDLPPLQRPGFVAPKPPATPAGAQPRSGVAKSFGSFVAQPGLPGSKKKPAKPMPAPQPGPVPQGGVAPVAGSAGQTVGPGRNLQPNKPLTKPGGTFGTPPARGKPKYLGLMLTALLLVFLGLVAAWSSFYLSADEDATVGSNVAGGEGAAIEAPLALAPAAGEDSGAATAPAPADVAALDPAVEEEMLADGEFPDGEPPADATAAPVATTEDLSLATSEGEGAVDPVAEAVAATVAGTDTPPAEAAAPDTLPVAEAAPAEAAEAEVAAAPVPEPAPETAISSDSPAAATLTEDQDEIFLAATDVPPPALDALALPVPQGGADAPPGAQAPPPPFGTVYQFDEKGLVRPTPEGILSPEGVMLFAGPPPVLPPARPESVVAAAAAAAAPAEPTTDAAASPAAAPLGSTAGVVAAPGAAPADATATDLTAPVADPALGGFRPRPRPADLTPPTADDASAPTDAATVVTSLRPRAKPETVISASATARAQSEAASLTAQAEAQLAAGDASNASLLAISRRPATRPQNFDRAVDAAIQLAVAEAVRVPEPQPEPEAAVALPEDDEEPELASAAPSVPLKGTVAKKATFVNALNLSKVNLIGVYGTDSRRYALVRQANGRFKKVRVGDNLDGGQVAAITASEVRYQKGGRLVSLKLPRG